MNSPAGQATIELRMALLRSEASAAAACVAALDRDHRIEVLLGGALRDARGDHRTAQLVLEAERSGRVDAAAWLPACQRLAEPPDTRHDDVAAAWVASGALPDRWRPEGRLPSPAELHALRGDLADVALVEAVRAGCGGAALVEMLADHPLHSAVATYYSGSIVALGWRPLVILALARATSG